MSSPETRCSSWPDLFVIPRFSYCAEMMLQTGKNEFNARGTSLSPTRKVRSDILESLAEEIIKYTVYPKDEQLEEVVKALVQSHPCLLEKGTRGGYCGWKHYLKIKMMNFRSKLRYVLISFDPIRSTLSSALTNLCWRKVVKEIKLQFNRVIEVYLLKCFSSQPSWTS